MKGRSKLLFRSLLLQFERNKCRYSSAACPKLSYFHNPGSESLHYLTIGQLVRRAAERWPDTAVFQSVQHQTSVTFSQADLQASKLAAGFLKLGLKPGDRVALCSPNTREWFLAALAAAKAGLILVSLNPAYRTAELEYCLEKVAVRALITEPFSKKSDYFQMMSQILPSLPETPHATKLSSSKLPSFQYYIINSKEKLPGTFRLCDVMDSTDDLQELETVATRLRPEICGNIQFTSGTTGRPKAVPLSYFNLINNSYFVGKRIGLDAKHYRILAQTPFFHVLGYIGALFTSLNFGSTMVLPSPGFDVKQSAHAIKQEKCTVLIGTPTMYVDLCSYVSSLSAEEQLQHQSPEIAVSGGALCAPQLFRNMKSTFSCDRVVSVYGLTETTAVLFQSTPEDSEFLMTSTVGRVSEHVEAKVVDAEGVTVPLGSPGELWLRSYNVMEGYWEDKPNTENILTPDRWLKTGDKFIMLEGGYGQVVGRIKDMIIRGGENISPKEVEELIITHPDIVDAQVYGVRSERLGEEVACSLRVKPGKTISQQQLNTFCKGKISHFKIPVYVDIIDEFPKTGSGKIQKFKLRENMEKKLASNTL